MNRDYTFRARTHQIVPILLLFSALLLPTLAMRYDPSARPARVSLSLSFADVPDSFPGPPPAVVVVPAPQGKSGQTDVPLHDTTTRDYTETSIAVHPTNPSILLAAANTGDHPGGDNLGITVFWSNSAGQSGTWSVLNLKDAGIVTKVTGDPAVAIRGFDGRFFVGYGVSQPTTTVRLGQGVAYSDPPHTATNWHHATVANPPDGYPIYPYEEFDKNHLAVDNNPSSVRYGWIYSAWSPLLTNTSEDNQIYLSYSTLAGGGADSTWSAPSPVSVGTAAGHELNQGVNLQIGPDGTLYAAWAAADGPPAGDLEEDAICFNRSSNPALPWGNCWRAIDNIQGQRTTPLPPSGIRMNSFPSMAVDVSNGPDRGAIYIVWTNLGAPGGSGGDPDIYLIKSTNGGTSFDALSGGQPIRVNQDATAKSQWFPWISCDPVTGTLSVVFYDRREAVADTAAVYVAESRDGGQSWSDFPVSDQRFVPTQVGATNYAGDYIGIASLSGTAWPCWMQPTLAGNYLAYISPVDLTSGDVAMFWNQSKSVSFDYTGNPYDSAGLDMEGDGDLDLFVTNTGGLGALMQDRKLTGAALPQFSNVRLQAFGVNDQPDRLRRLALADFDNDGKADVFAAARGSQSPPRLYRNIGDGTGQGLIFDDLANNLGGLGVDWAASANDSWTGAFGDYDRDGQLDLIIGRANTDGSGNPSTPLPDHLLRNRANLTFELADNATHLDQLANVSTTELRWADVDGDGDLDLFRGDHGGVGSQILLNNSVPLGSATFNVETNGIPTDLKAVTKAAFRDLNNDGYVDLVVVQDGGSDLKPRVLANNNGTGTFLTSLAVPTSSSKPFGGLALFDQDGDGKVDILATAAQANVAPLLLRNIVGGSGDTFLDATPAVGLGAADPSPAFSAVAADFGGTGGYDGDLDVYMARQTSGNHFFFQSVTASSRADNPVNRTVRVSLTAPQSGNNRWGIGARVKLEAPPTSPTLMQEQVVTGESARGFVVDQSETYGSTLSFGVGTYTGNVKITVTWPDGYAQAPKTQDDTVNPNFFFKDPHSPGLQDATATLTIYPEPAGLVDYEWRWETTLSSDLTREKVVVLNPLSGTACMSPITLTPTTYSVAYSVQPKVGGGYVRILRWSNQPCNAPCRIRWYVQVVSGTNTPETSTTRSFYMPVCIQ
jgi:hypothetical protein